MIFTVDKNKRTLSRTTSRAFLPTVALVEFIREIRGRRTATNASVREISRGESSVDGLAGPGQFRIHSEMHSASFQSAAHRERHIIDAAGNYAARKRPLITSHSRITPSGHHRIVLFRRNIAEKLRG